ncbi:hypothetical protein GGTG_10507 [Gaeumannomyces tritici R3-111a-1]|uniref:Uncharacterized protein n=1 Tax=Gaeumannomyces tritici (strain R3-111a-1) TaxID=644352 RepID=J3PAI1_GAET3|nr:hypothetical protein GGTG_10507 [Gaeumannomyces tritici R3-111a-1]EJT71247.1 hypothetical protein GGTG_10507 [Gaeumannomyces tritici R3-111a-1]
MLIPDRARERRGQSGTPARRLVVGILPLSRAGWVKGRGSMGDFGLRFVPKKEVWETRDRGVGRVGVGVCVGRDKRVEEKKKSILRTPSLALPTEPHVHHKLRLGGMRFTAKDHSARRGRVLVITYQKTSPLNADSGEIMDMRSPVQLSSGLRDRDRPMGVPEGQYPAHIRHAEHSRKPIFCRALSGLGEAARVQAPPM